MAKTTTSKLQMFVNRCLQKIFNIHWPEVISNEEFWRRTEGTEISIQIKRQKWNWIGHRLRKGMKPLKGRLWIGTHRGNRGEGDLNRRGEDRSTMRH